MVYGKGADLLLLKLLDLQVLVKFGIIIAYRTGIPAPFYKLHPVVSAIPKAFGMTGMTSKNKH